jgi:hypothetical protein
VKIPNVLMPALENASIRVGNNLLVFREEIPKTELENAAELKLSQKVSSSMTAQKSAKRRNQIFNANMSREITPMKIPSSHNREKRYPVDPK